MQNPFSEQTLVTASPYAKEHYLYLQKIGFLRHAKPHVSRSRELKSLLFFIVTIGRGKLIYRGRTWELRQGDCAWIDCSLPYSYESSSSSLWELKWVHFYGRGAAEFYAQFLAQGSPFVFTPSNPGFFNECLSSLFSLQAHGDPYKELLSHKYLTDLCVFCFPESKSRSPHPHGAQDKLEQIREYLLAHYMEKISLDELTRVFFISKYHLVREYRKRFGITPGNDLTACRLSHAKSLLRSGTQSVEEIAVLCGFHSSAYFIRMFKRSENMTPLEYRRKS
ncbi:MAG: helix-turn-helix transcriptional regulator [Lachnospiraceae bacterium]|nr:helix-turn-helix transcriptional regulator [Lachnospiraceae bacterium]